MPYTLAFSAKDLLKYAVALASTAMSAFTFAFDHASHPIHQHPEPIIINDVRMMDNAQLFLSVAVERDSSMSTQQREMNNYWLLNNGRQKHSGAAAMRALMRGALLTMRPLLIPSKASASTKPAMKRSAFTNINNYDLDLSENKIIIGFTYAFD